MNNTTLRRAVDAIKAGDRDQGRQLLLDFLKTSPNHETAILWLSATTNDSAQKRACFQSVSRQGSWVRLLYL